MPRQLSKPLQIWQKVANEYREKKKAEGHKVVMLPKKGTAEYTKMKKKYDELMKKEG